MIVPDFLTDRSVASQLAVLAAIHYCAKRTLAERIANITLLPPPLTAEAKAKAEAAKKAAADAAAIAAARPWYRRFFSYRTLEAFFPLLMLAAFEFLMLWLLPRISAPIVIHMFWVTLSSYLITGPISSCLYSFFGGPLNMSLVRGEKNPSAIMLKHESATPDNKPFFMIKRNRLIVSAMVMVGFVAYVAYDHENWVLPLFAGLVIVSMWSSVTFHTITVRMTSIFAFGFVALLGIVTPVIILGIKYFESTNSGDKTPSKLPVMPAWILSLMLIYNDAILGCPIMFLVMAAMRYDHFGPTASPSLGPEKARPGAAVDIPRSVETRMGPMYRTAMTTMAVCYLASGALVYHLNAIGAITVKPGQLKSEREYMIKLASFVSVNLVVPLVCAMVAWKKGELRDWWQYKEVWVPKDADLEAEQADINEAEKAITEPETVAADANNHVETVIAAEKA